MTADSLTTTLVQGGTLPHRLGDTNKRLVPTLVGAEEVLGVSQVRTVACGDYHTLVVMEAGDLWTCGRGPQG